MLSGFGAIIAVLCLWSLVGLSPSISLFMTWGSDYLNPYFLHKKVSKLNLFGVICLAIAVNLLCPACTLCYWFYKLCTVGRQ